MATDEAPDTAMLAMYSLALDEVYRLRQALAYEAAVTKAHLSLKSFPKSRRAFAEEQVERMTASARGEAERTYAGTSSQSLRHSMTEAGASNLLTRQMWEAAHPGRAGVSHDR